MAEPAATRSAALALADERALMRQGYRFLDEKRVLVAGEILRRLALHEAMAASLASALDDARAALTDALARHGLAGLQAYPAATIAPAVPRVVRSRFLGVSLADAEWAPVATGEAAPAVDASPEAQRCRAAFVALLGPIARLAASAGSIERLAAEYRRTERRARALENVLLPEVDGALRAIEERLELADQEEAVRIRLAGRRRAVVTG